MSDVVDSDRLFCKFHSSWTYTDVDIQLAALCQLQNHKINCFFQMVFVQEFHFFIAWIVAVCARRRRSAIPPIFDTTSAHSEPSITLCIQLLE